VSLISSCVDLLSEDIVTVGSSLVESKPPNPNSSSLLPVIKCTCYF
jgi:hypothetical protein